MIYKTFKEWKDGNYLEDLEPRKEAYTRDELLLIEMGWNYGYDAGAAAEREACAKVLDDWKKHNWTFEDCAAVIRARGK